MNKLYSVKEICNLFNIHRNTFYTRISKLLPIIKILSKKKRQNLYSKEQMEIIADMLKKDLKKFK